MSTCEKCWADAHRRQMQSPAKSVAQHYRDLIQERKDNPCMPEEQAGWDAKICPKCKRKTLHQITGKCMTPNCEAKP